MPADGVQQIEVVAVALRLVPLVVDVLPQGGAEDRALQVVGRQRVAGQQGVAVALFDQRGHRLARIVVESHGRAEDPDDVAVVALVTQQVVQGVVIAREGELAGAARVEGELIVARGGVEEAVGVDEDPFLRVLRPADDHPIAAARRAGHGHGQLAASDDDDAVHAALRAQHPHARLHLDVLGQIAGRVEIVRDDAVGRAGLAARHRGAAERLSVEIWDTVFGQLKGHGSS